MDETAIAFELPHVRAAATGADAPLDRISVRDYTRAVEIGAYAAERGTTQRVRFNIVLEVAHHAAAEDDDVDKVISYDTITEAIDAELAHERINLLETLADRVARRVLADPRALRAFVRIEKLDRIPGALGVEIVRARADGATRLRPTEGTPAPTTLRPRVVHLDADVLAGPQGAAWRDALAGLGGHVLSLGPRAPQPPAGSEAELRIGLLAIEQAAWALAAADPRFTVAASRSEIDWSVRHGLPTIWAPTKLIVDAARRPAADASAPAALAVWLAAELGARSLVVVGAHVPATEGATPVIRLAADAPGALSGAAKPET